MVRAGMLLCGCRRIGWLLSAALVVSTSTGCWLGPWMRRQETPQTTVKPPAMFTASPALSDVLFAVNSNSQMIQQLQSDSVQLTVAGFRLHGNLAVQTPRNFRLQAGLSKFTGQDLDIGSNQDHMWFWTKWHPQPAVYHVQHHQFETSAASQLIPVHPKFLIEAIGIVYLDPQGIHDGPYPAGDNRLVLRSRIQSPQTGREMIRITTLDDKYGWIMEQELQDASGRTLAKAIANGHRFYPTAGVSLAHQLDVTLGPGQPNEMSFHIKVGSYNLGVLMGNPEQLWTMPNIGNAPRVDLANPQGTAGPQATTARNPYQSSPTVYGQRRF